MEGEEEQQPATIYPADSDWSTGQDAVKVIKGELLQLLPGIKIFLDARRCSAALATHREPL